MKVEEVVVGVEKHPALNNGFYSTWASRQLSIAELQIFARNYNEWVQSFPKSLDLLAKNAFDEKIKVEYKKTLYSELGNGRPEKAHWKLLDYFFSELAFTMSEGEKLSNDYLKENIDLLPTTQELVRNENAIYGGKNLAFAAGAQLALEWQAYTMLRKLYEGARNYLPLWKNPDEFHQACEYFYVHLGMAEKEHKKESLVAAQQTAKNSKNIEEIKNGYEKHLELIEKFWKGIHREISNT